MKWKILLILLPAFFCLVKQGKAQRKNKPDKIAVTIRLKSSSSTWTGIDSVLVIFDKYDLSGAGVVKKICYPVNNTISIEEVPEGRYFIDLVCLGMNKYNLKRQSFIYKGKNNLAFILPRTEIFIPGTFIAQDDFNVNTLAIATYGHK